MKSSRLLKKIFSRKKKENVQFSLRKSARFLKISPGYLSKIISGQKPIPRELLKKIIVVFEMDPLEAAELINSLKKEVLDQKVGKTAEFDFAKSQKEEKFDLSEYELLPEQAEWLLSKWYYFILMDLTTCENFQNDIKWISQQLGIPAGEVATSLKFLEENGLLVKDEKGHWQKKYQSLRFPTIKTKKTVRQFHAMQIEKGLKYLDTHTAPKDFSQRLISSVSFAANSAKLEQAKQILNQAMHEVATLMSESDTDSVYSINVQFFPQTKG